MADPMAEEIGEKPQTETERLLKKLTSHACSKRVLDDRGGDAANSDKSDSRNTSLRGDSLDIDKVSSAEVLKQMRRDSGAASESRRSSQIKYSKGTSILGEEPVKDTDAVLKVRPDLKDKFRPGVVNQIIESVIKEHLTGHIYSVDEAPGWVKSISDGIKEKTKAQNFPRYKLIVNVVLGERREQGLSSCYRCLWDAEADCAASYTFMNDSIFCIGLVFGIYLY